MYLGKSLAQLDAAADELLKKSQTADKPEEKEEVSPDDISSDAPAADEEDEEGGEGEGDEDGESEEDLKKSESPESLDEGENNGGDEEESTPEELEKSFADDFEADPIISQGLEGSEFLSAVVEVLAKSLSDIQYSNLSASKNISQENNVLAKSLLAITASNQALRADNERLTRRVNKLEKSIEQGFDKIMDSLDTISSQPAHMRKSIGSVNVLDKNFGASLNGTPVQGGFESLSKSQVLSVLNNELYSGNTNVTPTDIISYESGAPLRPDLQSLVASKAR